MSAIGSGPGGTTLLVDENTVGLWRFREQEAYHEPKDASPSAVTLVARDPAHIPTVVEGLTGWARQFDTGDAFLVEDAADALLLRRSMTIEALVSIDYAAAHASGTYYIAQRGDEAAGDATELRAFFFAINTWPTARLLLGWQPVADTVVELESADIPASTGWHHVAAVRRWTSSTSVEVRFFFDGRPIGVATSTTGDIGGGAAGHFMVGMSKVNTTIGNYWRDKIQILAISDVARSDEEIEHRARTLLEIPPQIYSAFRARTSGVDGWSPDEGAAVRREMAVEGDALAYAQAHADELTRYYLPDKAYRTLADWERVTGLAPTAGDTIETRRVRVCTFLRKVHGFSRDEIRDALAEILDVAEADVGILEYSNTFDEGFAALGGAWLQEPNSGTLTAANDLVMAMQAGDDARWDADRRLPVAARTSVIEYADVDVRVAFGKWDQLGNVGDYAGIFVFNGATHAGLLFGVRKSAGGYEFVTVTYSGVLGVAPTVDVSAVPVPASGDLWIRLVRGPTTDAVTVAYSQTSIDGPWTTVDTAAVGAVTWAGLALVGAEAAATNASTVTFDDFRLFTPKGRGVFRWYVHRDPTDPGTPDLVGAQLALDKMRPAHTEATVCESTAALYDDAHTVYDRDPIGA